MDLSGGTYTRSPSWCCHLHGCEAPGGRGWSTPSSQELPTLGEIMQDIVCGVLLLLMVWDSVIHCTVNIFDSLWRIKRWCDSKSTAYSVVELCGALGAVSIISPVIIYIYIYIYRCSIVLDVELILWDLISWARKISHNNLCLCHFSW